MTTYAAKPNPSLRRAFAGALLVAAALMPGRAEAAFCGERAKLVDGLTQRYEEAQAGLGISQDGSRLFELFVSPKGTWTALVSTAEGRSCIIAAGHSWQDVERGEAGEIF